MEEINQGRVPVALFGPTKAGEPLEVLLEDKRNETYKAPFSMTILQYYYVIFFMFLRISFLIIFIQTLQTLLLGTMELKERL